MHQVGGKEAAGVSAWNNPAFDNGAKQGMWQYGFDMTMRF